ncbi:MAG: Na+/H+ antiporter NhaC family protein [Pseudomonadota bacterium]
MKLNSKFYSILAVIIVISILVLLSIVLKPNKEFLLFKCDKSLVSSLIEKIDSQDINNKIIKIKIDSDNPNRTEKIKEFLESESSREIQYVSSSYDIEIIIQTKDNYSQITYISNNEKTQLEKHIPSWWSILPPIFVVLFSIVTRFLLPSLLLGIFGGALIEFIIIRDIPIHKVFSAYFASAIFEEFKFSILIFTVSLIATVAIVTKNGGIQGILNIISKYMKKARSTRIATSLMGLLIFFDDYSNTMIIGTTIRPISDKMKISREKLAYLVDSTSAPVAGLAIISTWIGFEIGLFQDILVKMGIENIGGYQAFFQALPFRFYCIFTIFFVFLTSITSRDFGPMLKAEQRAMETGKLYKDGAKLLTSKEFTNIKADLEKPQRAYNALVPILTIIFSTAIGIMLDGNIINLIKESGFSFSAISNSFMASENSVQILAISSVFGLFLSIALTLIQKIVGFKDTFITIGIGLKAMYLAFVILILAWTLAALCESIGTAEYLVSIFIGKIPAVLITIIIFLSSAFIALSTGSSWNTMALMIPISVPLAYSMGGMDLIFISMAAVLDGSIFGDHCSPISDTTILSSISSSSDHVDHVRTQIPYATICMVVAIFPGYLLSYYHVPSILLYLMGFGILTGFLFLFGKKHE